MEDKLQKRANGALKEKTQYFLTFGVIGAMLYVAQFPLLVIFFFGVFAYFLWKTFSTPSRQGIREVFEFYLSANEILRDDERRWFGFEIQNVIARGERIVQTMSGAPPLVYFALGALYNKSGDHEAAVQKLTYVVNDEMSNESTYLHPSGDLKSYVRVLRKIEREPAEAPQMSAAVRALERARKNRANILLEESRAQLEAGVSKRLATEGSIYSGERRLEDGSDSSGQAFRREDESEMQILNAAYKSERDSKRGKSREREPRSPEDMHEDRKPISEVLHDIYDKNIQ